MENPEKVLAELKKQTTKQIPLNRPKTHDALQPRNKSVLLFRDRHKQDALEEEQIVRFRLQLETSNTVELDAVLVAKVAGKYYLLDGHHRLKAYKRARRTSIPAKTLEMPWGTAVLVTKLVNLGGIKLPLFKRQATECAWQHIAAVTNLGKQWLPVGSSTRSLGARFGIGHNTVASMIKRWPLVNLREYPTESCDAGTGLPLWKYVRGNMYSGLEEALGPETVEQRRVEKCAAQIAKTREQFGDDTFGKGIQLLKQDGEDEKLDALEELLNDPMDDEALDTPLS